MGLLTALGRLFWEPSQRVQKPGQEKGDQRELMGLQLWQQQQRSSSFGQSLACMVRNIMPSNYNDKVSVMTMRVIVIGKRAVSHERYLPLVAKLPSKYSILIQ